MFMICAVNPRAVNNSATVVRGAWAIFNVEVEASLAVTEFCSLGVTVTGFLLSSTFAVTEVFLSVFEPARPPARGKVVYGCFTLVGIAHIEYFFRCFTRLHVTIKLLALTCLMALVAIRNCPFSDLIKLL